MLNSATTALTRNQWTASFRLRTVYRCGRVEDVKRTGYERVPCGLWLRYVRTRVLLASGPPGCESGGRARADAAVIRA